jgi:1-acyl-sn-glycerol-3-phosphate acyltransferase
MADEPRAAPDRPRRRAGAAGRKTADPRPVLTHLPGPRVAPWRRTARYWIARVAVFGLVRAWLRIRVEGREHLPDGPAVLCFNHLNWSDPFVLMGTLPMRPRLFFFGPKEEDMTAGGRNRLMTWTGTTVPYKPGKNDLLGATRAVRDVFASGAVLAIAGEGRIHRRESEILPLNEGAAYFALRWGVPLVPVAINGTSWLRFGGRVRVRIGRPVEAEGRPTREALASVTARTRLALCALVADQPELPEPGRFGRWMTELFNEWPEGSRPSLGG